MGLRPAKVFLISRLAAATLAIWAAPVAAAEDGQEEASPPGILVEPPRQAPGGRDDEDAEDAPRQPGGPGCPVNDQPLELLV